MPLLSRKRMLRKPLAAWVFYSRNPGKSVPIILAILLAITLIAGVVAVMNSVPLSIRKIYGHGRFFTGATSRGDMRFFPELLTHFEKSPVPIERKVVCQTATFEIKSLVGPWPFLVYGLKSKDVEYVTKKLGLRVLEGRLPRPGEPEAAITLPVARNLRLSIGDVLLAPDREKRYSPQPVRVVGIWNSEEWFAITSYEYLFHNHFPPLDALLVFAKDGNMQRQLDVWAEKSLLGKHARAYTYIQLEKETRQTFATLFAILNLVIGMLVILVTLMMSMLIQIFLSQRSTEFGLLQAIGFTKKQLMRRVLAESFWITIVGWISGAIFALLIFLTVKNIYFEPRGYYLNPFDVPAFLYTAPIPLAIFLASFFTVWNWFRRFDPITIIERRIA
ncbi:MAG TPA: ABC transporter permease [Fimbriimonadales bacterium]|nr:ABC transporter permease [Fimbriimonadales bacterium]